MLLTDKPVRSLDAWRRLWRAIYSLPWRMAHIIAPFVFVVAAYVWRVLRPPHRQVRSVLHISVLSHKQYMVTRALRAQGIRADLLALNATPDSILNIGYDYFVTQGDTARSRWKRIYFLLFLCPRYDVIHYHFNALLTHRDELELTYLKRMGKAVVFHFRGCDVRHRSANMRINPELNCCAECDYPMGSCDTQAQYRRIALTQKYGDGLLATTPDLKDFVPAAEHFPFIAPVGIDFDAIEPAERSFDVFRVVTSSNHPGVDGVPHIRAAVSRLISEGHSIELIEVTKRPYREALAIYKSADVFAGKLRMGYYNNANIETMMLGVPNMSYIRPEFMERVPDCPIINTRPDTIYQNLKYWMVRREELKELGRRGPDFVRRHHDPGDHARNLIAFYNRLLARAVGESSNRQSNSVVHSSRA